MNSSLAKISIISLLLLSAVAIADGAHAQTVGQTYTMDGKSVPASFFEAGQHVREGITFLRANRNQEASVQFKQAIAIAPDFAEAHHNYGLALARLGDISAAIEQLKLAVSLKPSLDPGWLSLGGLYQSSGQMDDAVKTYSEFLKRFPNNPQAPKIANLIKGLKQETSNESSSVVETLGMTAPSSPAPDDYLADITKRGTLRWPAERIPIKVYIRPSTNVPGFLPRYDEIVRQSFSAWSKASGGLVKFQFVPTPATADIELSWTNDSNKFANSAEAGETRLSSNHAGIVHSTIQLCTVSIMPGMTVNPNRVRMIALHEIGHALGLTGHTTNPADAMFYSATIVDQWRDLSPRDAKTITRLYSPIKATPVQNGT